jgi:hypothetical protein
MVLPFMGEVAQAQTGRGTLIVRVRSHPRPGQWVGQANVPVFLNGGYLGVTDGSKASGMLRINNVPHGRHRVEIIYRGRRYTQNINFSRGSSMMVDFVVPH